MRLPSLSSSSSSSPLLHFLPHLLLTLLLSHIPSTSADDDDMASYGDEEAFVVTHISATAVGNGVSWYQFGVNNLKDKDHPVYCIGIFSAETPGEQRVPCGRDEVNVRVQQPPSLFAGDGFNILVNWNLNDDGPTGRVEYPQGLPGFIQPIGGSYNWFLSASKFDYGP